jgi:hypothetical protein
MLNPELLKELIAYHEAEAKTYGARASQSDNPTAAKWLGDMQDKHAAWCEAVRTLVRESVENALVE